MRNEDEKLNDCGDYVLAQSESCWIKVGPVSVYVSHTRDGIEVSLYRVNREMEEGIDEMYLTFEELNHD